MGGICDLRSDRPDIELNGYWLGTKYGGQSDSLTGRNIDQSVRALEQLRTRLMSNIWIQYVASECTYVFTVMTGDPVGWFSYRLKLESGRDGVIGTILRAGRSVVRIPAGVRNVFLSKRFYQRYSLHIYWVLSRSGRDVNSVIHLDLISKLRMSEAIWPCPYMWSRCGQRQLYFSLNLVWWSCQSIFIN